MITIPITQFELILSMVIAEIMLISDAEYIVKIGSENYFSLTVGAAVGLFFIFVVLAIRFASGIQFNEEEGMKHNYSPAVEAAAATATPVSIATTK